MQLVAALRDGDTTSHDDYELRYQYVETGLKGGRHVIESHHPGDGQVGRLEWMGRPPYSVHSLEVSDAHQRKGLATAMWDWSQAQGRPKPTHSRQRTDKGDAWARSVGGKLPRRESKMDISSYFGGGDGISGTSLGSYFGGRGKPRRDGGGAGAASDGAGRGAPQGGEAGPGDSVGAGQGGTRSVEFHPQAVKDLAALDKPVQRQIHGVIEGLAAGTVPLAQTHTLTKALSGWSTTKASRGHRIVHRNTEDGGLHIGYIGLHDYGKAERRLGAKTLDELEHHQRAVAEAQAAVREQYPSMLMAIRPGEDADDYLRHVLKAHGHPRHEDAFVSVHDGSRSFSSTAMDRETGAVGVVLHPARADYGTLAHEAAHLLHDHQTGRKFREPAPDDSVHGIGYIGHYAKLLEPFGKSRTPGGNRKGGGPGDLLLNTYYDSLNRNRKTASADEHKPLPTKLFHVTTARDDVLEHGLKTREELGQRHGHGFGSGRDDTISLTAHKPTAEHLLHSLHEYHDVLNGKTSLTELKEKARNGVGAKKPYDFMFDEHDHSDKRLAEIDSGHVTEPRFHMLGEEPEGWKPLDKGMTGQDGRQAHMLWDRPLSENEKIKHRAEVYGNFAWGRQASGGHMDPLFMGNSPREFAKKDPSQFALLHVRPRPGAHGIQMNDRTEGTDAGEWRALSGHDLDVVHHESREDIPPRVAARSQRWYHGTGRKLEPGAVLQPGLDSHKPDGDHDHVWLSDDPERAGTYGDVYEVHVQGEPVLTHKGSAEYYLKPGGSATVHKFVGNPKDAPVDAPEGTKPTIKYTPSPSGTSHRVDALHGKRTVGNFGWDEDGVLGDWVHPDYRDSGLRDQMIQRARRKGFTAEASTHSAPTSRVFGPTFGLDHRLFEGEHLKPEVRAAVMGRLGPVIEPLLGQSWEAYTKVYLAGSEASEWTSATLEGNGDFDTLIGIDYDHARDMHSPLHDLADADITDMVNTALRMVYNASPWVAPFGGTWDVTGYVNANSYDITKIKPYAAYNISDDAWSVRPPHLPDWSIEKLPEGGDNLLAEAEGYAAVVDAIDKMPEPFRTQQGKALWKHLHSDRGRAFSDEGEGWLDPGNLIEKALVEWGVWDKLVEWQYGKQRTAMADPPTIKRGVILDGHPYRGHTEHGWDPGGWDADVAHRLVNGTATHHDVLKHVDTNNVGHFWYHPDHADLEDAQTFAEPREPLDNWLDDPQEDGRISGEAGVVMEAHHPEGWDPDKNNPAHPLMGNSYLPDHSHLKLHKLHYTTDGEKWHTIPMEHHGITLHTDGPGEQKTAASAYDSDDDDHYRSYTDWDKTYSKLPEDIHRGVAVQLPAELHDVVHDESRSQEERAHAALKGATLKPLGMHWSAAGAGMASRIAEDEAENLTPRERRNTTHVVLHADRPERHDIETDINRLVQHSVISHGRSPENEVPLKEDAPVNVWGVSWKHHDAPGWNFHEFDEPMRKTAVKSSDHEHAPDLPEEQHEALTAEPLSAYWDKTLQVAKDRKPGTHMWRGETRSGDPVQGARETGVGMHWGVNPSNIVFPHPSDNDGKEEASVVYHAELEHPDEQSYPRSHPMWRGKHQSLDHEAEIRLKPGSKVKLHGVWVKDPKHPDPGYFIPRMPERMSSAWSYHPIGEHVTVAHRPKHNMIDYGDVGIGKEGNVIDITAYFKTAEDDDYRMMHRPPNHESGQPLHEADGSDDPDEHVRIYRSAPPHVDYFDTNTWATTNPAYAHQHGYGAGTGGKDWPVMSAEVPKRHVFTDHNDENEVGYQGPRLESHHIESHDEETGTHSPWESMSEEELKEEERGGNSFHGMGVHLPPADHAFVHDKSQPIAERAHRLFQHVPERLRENGGYDWEDEHHSAELDTLDEDRHHGDHPTPVTQVVVHGSQNLDHAHGLSWANSEDDPIHPFRDYEHHEFKGNPNDRLNKHSMLDYFGAAA